MGGTLGQKLPPYQPAAVHATLLLTQNLETIGQMSCNPAVGGIAKGTVVREVDALGGIMGQATDLACIQFRMLNRSKGPAVWSPRAQCDRGLYRRAVRTLLERHSRIEFAQGTVANLLVSAGKVDGVRTLDGRSFAARAIVLTAGTFLRGLIHQGLETKIPAGRAGDAPALDIARQLEELGLQVQRFKTGTPPRIDGRSVNLTNLQRQDGDAEPFWFSYYKKVQRPEQRPCFLTYTGEALRQIVCRHLQESALYGGAISGRGPRYCPSIEDKIIKFSEAERHQVFLEPEGLDTSEMYVNGLSTSLPPRVQLEFLRTVPGLEAVRMTRAGYAIEYDYYPPTQLQPTLESKIVAGLFLAGQVNGTTGYEEAAGQGSLAGLNAAAHATGKDPVLLGRDQAFIGVLIDDLVSRGVDEPYRLFTSRSEYRLLVRQDNALRRLYPLAQRLGLLSVEEERTADRRLRAEEEVRSVAEAVTIAPALANPILGRLGSAPLTGAVRVAELARRPEVPLSELLVGIGHDVVDETGNWADIEFKYAGYLAREQAAAARLARMNDFLIPEQVDYLALSTLSFEAREKLQAIQPRSLGQAGRIPGVSPSDIQSLVFELLKLSKSVSAVSRETVKP